MNITPGTQMQELLIDPIHQFTFHDIVPVIRRRCVFGLSVFDPIFHGVVDLDLVICAKWKIPSFSKIAAENWIRTRPGKR